MRQIRLCFGHCQSKRHGYFIDHTQLLEYLRNRLLSICGNCRRFEFRIYLGSDKEEVTNIITAILGIQQVTECSNVQIGIVVAKRFEQLPIEAISSWLHRNRNTTHGGNEFANQSQYRIYGLQAQYCHDPTKTGGCKALSLTPHSESPEH